MKVAPAEQARKLPASDLASSLSPPRIVTLSNGRYTVRLSEAGSGFARLGEVAVTRWHGDEIADADGFYLYLRDLEDDQKWSAGYQPMRVAPTQYEFRARERSGNHADGSRHRVSRAGLRLAAARL